MSLRIPGRPLIAPRHWAEDRRLVAERQCPLGIAQASGRLLQRLAGVRQWHIDEQVAKRCRALARTRVPVAARDLEDQLRETPSSHSDRGPLTRGRTRRVPAAVGVLVQSPQQAAELPRQLAPIAKKLRLGELDRVRADGRSIRT
jgi:hypothetical protein